MSTKPSLPSFTTFGEMLRYLRRRARLTQRELSIAVGYSESMISRLEHNERPPDVATLLAIFVPALRITNEQETIAQLTTLAQMARGERASESKRHDLSLVEGVSPIQSSKIRLPQRLTSFVGRETELVAVSRLLAQARLVTLTGTGGCGKTSLAIEIARALAEIPYFHDGIYLVELLPLTAPTLFAQSILMAMGIEGNRERSALEILLSVLGSKHILLVLDNCEHLIDASAHAIQSLLRSCANLRILVTSREQLNIPGEMLFTVPPLDFPDPHFLPDLAALSQFASVQLFVDRSQGVIPNFRLTDKNAHAVAQICARLDGIPLALELASAALLTFSVQEVAKQLDAHFLLFTSGYRTANVRHQSLNNTVAWSYNLLSIDEQRLLARFAVFVGGWNVAAMQAINPDLTNTLALLQQLVQKSLVRVERDEASTESHTRYHLLRAIREYALERLAEQEDEGIIRRRHFDYFAQLSKEMGGQVMAERHPEAMACLDADYDNIRSAFAYAKFKDDLADARTLLAAALPYYWHLRGLVAEGQSWLQEMIANEHLLLLSTRAWAYAALLHLNTGIFHWHVLMGDLEENTRLLTIAEPLIVSTIELGDHLAAAQLMLVIGSVYSFCNKWQTAEVYGKRSLQIFQNMGNFRGITLTHSLLTWLTFQQGNVQVAQRMQEEHIHSLQQSGANWSLCEVYALQAEFARVNFDKKIRIHHLKQLIALAEREKFTLLLHNTYYELEILDADAAIQMAESFLDRQRTQGNSVVLAVAFHQLGRMYLNCQYFERAQAMLDEALAIWRSLNEWPGQNGWLPWSLIDRGQSAYFLGDRSKALACFDESIERFAASYFPVGAALPFNYRGYVRLAQNDLRGAFYDFSQVIHNLKKGLGNWQRLIYRALGGIGEVARQQGNLKLAAQLLAVISSDEAMKLEKATRRLFHEVADHDRIMAAIPIYQQDPIFAAAWQEGEKLSLEEAIALALLG